MHDRRVGFLWKAMGVFLFFILVQNVVAVAAVVVAAGKLGMGFVAAMQSDTVLDLVDSWSPALILITDGLVVLSLLLWSRFRLQRPLADYTALRKPLGLKVGVLCVFAGVAANFWFALAINMLPWPQGWMSEYSQNVSNLGGYGLLTLLAVILFAPVCEELVFRGRVYDNLSQIVPAGVAVVLQAALFGSLHAGTIWMIYAFCVGCVLGYVRRLTGSLRGSLCMHISFNATSLLFDFVGGYLEKSTAAVLLTLIGSALLFLFCIYWINRLCRKEEAR